MHSKVLWLADNRIKVSLTGLERYPGTIHGISREVKPRDKIHHLHLISTKQGGEKCSLYHVLGMPVESQGPFVLWTGDTN